MDDYSIQSAQQLGVMQRLRNRILGLTLRLARAVANSISDYLGKRTPPVEPTSKSPGVPIQIEGPINETSMEDITNEHDTDGKFKSYDTTLCVCCLNPDGPQALRMAQNLTALQNKLADSSPEQEPTQKQRQVALLLLGLSDHLHGNIGILCAEEYTFQAYRGFWICDDKRGMDQAFHKWCDIVSQIPGNRQYLLQKAVSMPKRRGNDVYAEMIGCYFSCNSPNPPTPLGVEEVADENAIRAVAEWQIEVTKSNSFGYAGKSLKAPRL